MAELEHAEDAARVSTAVRVGGGTPHLADGRCMTDRAAALDAIAGALSFPRYFGHNLDALFDCLVDRSWLTPGEHVLIWSHHDVLADADATAYSGVVTALRDALARDAHPDRRLRIVLTTS
jgi:RNAse (barnase) inhibitor barstar